MYAYWTLKRHYMVPKQYHSQMTNKRKSKEDTTRTPSHLILCYAVYDAVASNAMMIVNRIHSMSYSYGNGNMCK